jgi:hypothetical protein
MTRAPSVSSFALCEADPMAPASTLDRLAPAYPERLARCGAVVQIA